MSDTATVGAVVSAFLERAGVGEAFGVISIHNMPILDAIATRGQIRFVPTRGEAGAINMADANARVRHQLGVAITSTGTGAGNAAGAMIEAQTAGTPILHLTGQIETAHLDRRRGYIHEAEDQLGMLEAVSKAAFRVRDAHTALSTLREAVRVAMTPPRGPVSVEIPIDIQSTRVSWPADLTPHPVPIQPPDTAQLDHLADLLVRAKRPMLWLGGGARDAGTAVRRLVDMGFGVVTSTNGRGVIPEDHGATLGAYTMSPATEALYATCDALVVAGSRLRGNETLKYTLKLPSPLYHIDVDPGAENRCYPSDAFLCADAVLSLEGLADRLDGRTAFDPDLHRDIAAAKREAESKTIDGIAPYGPLIEAIEAVAGRSYAWVRDVTIANSSWGNRTQKVFAPGDGVHAVGGGIGQGLPMAIGAAMAGRHDRVFALVGDGGLQLCLGELATAVQEKANLVLIVMNSASYGVIKNIQDAHYGGRNVYADLLTPAFGTVCKAVGMKHILLDDIAKAGEALHRAVRTEGPVMVEVDMGSIGDFRHKFAGPPVRAKTETA